MRRLMYIVRSIVIVLISANPGWGCPDTPKRSHRGSLFNDKGLHISTRRKAIRPLSPIEEDQLGLAHIKRRPWAREEDYVIIQFANEHIHPDGKIDWRGVTEHIPHRSRAACATRYNSLFGGRVVCLTGQELDNFLEQRYGSPQDHDADAALRDDFERDLAQLQPAPSETPRGRARKFGPPQDHDADAALRADFERDLAELHPAPSETPRRRARKGKSSTKTVGPMRPWTSEEDLALVNYFRYYSNPSGQVDWGDAPVFIQDHVHDAGILRTEEECQRRREELTDLERRDAGGEPLQHTRDMDGGEPYNPPSTGPSSSESSSTEDEEGDHAHAQARYSSRRPRQDPRWTLHLNSRLNGYMVDNTTADGNVDWSNLKHLNRRWPICWLKAQAEHNRAIAMEAALEEDCSWPEYMHNHPEVGWEDYSRERSRTEDEEGEHTHAQARYSSSRPRQETIWTRELNRLLNGYVLANHTDDGRVDWSELRTVTTLWPEDCLIAQAEHNRDAAMAAAQEEGCSWQVYMHYHLEVGWEDASRVPGAMQRQERLRAGRHRPYNDWTEEQDQILIDYALLHISRVGSVDWSELQVETVGQMLSIRARWHELHKLPKVKALLKAQQGVDPPTTHAGMTHPRDTRSQLKRVPVPKTCWTPEQDDALRDYAEHHTSSDGKVQWGLLRHAHVGHSFFACKKRLRQLRKLITEQPTMADTQGEDHDLTPGGGPPQGETIRELKEVPSRRIVWTAEKDQILIDYALLHISRVGNVDWSELQEETVGHTMLSIRDRWHVLQKRPKVKALLKARKRVDPSTTQGERTQSRATGYQLEEVPVVHRLWSTKDDNALRAYVATHIKHHGRIDWLDNPEATVGHSNAACRARWPQLTEPRKVKERRATQHESDADTIPAKALDEYIPGRRARQIRVKDRTNWTAEEDSILRRLEATHRIGADGGGSWWGARQAIKKSLPGRTVLGCKRRASRLAEDGLLADGAQGQESSLPERRVSRPLAERLAEERHLVLYALSHSIGDGPVDWSVDDTFSARRSHQRMQTEWTRLRAVARREAPIGTHWRAHIRSLLDDPDIDYPEEEGPPPAELSSEVHEFHRDPHPARVQDPDQERAESPSGGPQGSPAPLDWEESEDLELLRLIRAHTDKLGMVASAEIQAALPHRSLAELKLRWEAIRGGYGIERHWVDKPEPLALGSLIGFRPLFGAEVNSPEFRWAEKRTTEDPITGHKTVWLNCSCNAEAFASPEPLVTQIPVLDDYEGIIEERLLAQVAQGTILSKAEISRQKMIIIEDLAREEARRLEERLASLHGGSPIPPLPPRTHESTSTSSEDHSTDASGHRPFMRGGWSRPPSPSDPWRRRDSEDTTESSEAHSPIEAGGFSSARRGGWSCPPAPPDPWRSRDEDEGSYSDEADSIDSSTEYSDESSEGEEDASIEVSLGAEDGSIDLSSEYSVEGSEEEDASSVSSNEDSDVGSEGGESDDSPEEGIRPVLRGSWQTGVAPTPGSSTTRAIASTALTMWDDRLGDHAQRGDTLGRLAGVDPKNTDTWVREGN